MDYIEFFHTLKQHKQLNKKNLKEAASNLPIKRKKDIKNLVSNVLRCIFLTNAFLTYLN